MDEFLTIFVKTNIQSEDIIFGEGYPLNENYISLRRTQWTAN